MSTDAAQETQKQQRLKEEFEAWVVETGRYTKDQVKKRKISGEDEYFYLGLNELWNMWLDLYARFQRITAEAA